MDRVGERSGVHRRLRGNRAQVFVRTPAYGPKYLQTRADGVWTNNLLALPER
ncbi:DUF3892 domain-containing protein [Streptomyces sp. NPDC003300]|uniref:DUF3892 domain-containing protein n=1 Tax=unclassified Streptomyces TaxID=2593676 RepID=UPI0033B07C1C